MKKIKNKRAVKHQITKTKKGKSPVISVQNAKGTADTKAQILVHNKISYTPKVSVIIPVYNVGEYLRECLDSVINQTLKEIEIICVDDGSTDNSLDILKEYAAKDKRITVLTQPNCNAGKARNEGLAIAKGTYVGFVDSDDYISADMYQKLYTKAYEGQTDICICEFNIIDSNTKHVLNKAGITKWFAQKFTRNTDSNLLVHSHAPILQITNPAPWNKIYNRHFLIKNGIKFQSIISTNDVAFTCTALCCAKIIGLIEEPLYFYRTNTHKSLTDTKDSNLYCFYEAIQELHNRLTKLQKFQSFQQSFINAIIGHCLYNFDKVNNANKNTLKNLFVKELFPKYNITQENLSIIYSSVYKDKVKDFLTLSSTPKVSVVLPIYNASGYLRECLDSICKQTLKDIEIICVNDGSTDNSLQIIKEYAAKDIRIRYIDKPNGGYGQTMNCGMELARGEYIGIVEPDDFIKPEMYETLYKQAKKLNLDIIKADYYKFKTINGKYNFTKCRVFSGGHYNRVINCKNNKQLLYSLTINPAGIFKKEFLDRYHIKHNETPGASYQDNGFWLFTTYLASKIYFIDQAFYCYRQDNPEQSMKKTTNIQAIFTEYRLIEEKLKSINLENFYTQAFIYRQFLAFSYHLQARISIDCWPKYLELFYNVFNKYVSQKQIDWSYFSTKQKEELQIILRKDFDKYIEKYAYPEIIISLTSYPARINTVTYTIESLLNQSVKANRIILWLAPEQFPNKEQDLPSDLLALKNQGLTIDWYHDIKSYKKLIPTLRKYPEAIIVTADDDALYPVHWLRQLLIAHKAHPKSIITHRAHIITLTNGKIANYKSWKLFNRSLQPIVNNSFLVFFTGLGGVLYPPHCLSKDIFDEVKFLSLCPNGDDIWFWAQAILNGTKIYLIQHGNLSPRVIEGTQDCALWKTNVDDNHNDVQIEALLKQYPQILSILKREKTKLLYLSYIKFPVNLVKRMILRKKYREILLIHLVRILQMFRVDIRNIGFHNTMDIIGKQVKITTPDWFTDSKGVGQVVEASALRQILRIKMTGSGKLSFVFRGQDKRFGQTRIPIWADYKSIKIDGKEILSAPVATWHDRPFRYEMPVKDGQIVRVEIEQQPHKYSQAELTDIIFKLFPNNEYIKRHITYILKTCSRFIKPETKKPSRLCSITRMGAKTIIYVLGLKFTHTNKQKELLQTLQQHQQALLQAVTAATRRNDKLEQQNVALAQQVNTLNREMQQAKMWLKQTYETFPTLNKQLANAQETLLSQLVTERKVNRLAAIVSIEIKRQRKHHQEIETSLAKFVSTTQTDLQYLKNLDVVKNKQLHKTAEELAQHIKSAAQRQNQQLAEIYQSLLAEQEALQELKDMDTASTDNLQQTAAKLADQMHAAVHLQNQQLAEIHQSLLAEQEALQELKDMDAASTDNLQQTAAKLADQMHAAVHLQNKQLTEIQQSLLAEQEVLQELKDMDAASTDNLQQTAAKLADQMHAAVHLQNQQLAEIQQALLAEQEVLQELKDMDAAKTEYLRQNTQQLGAQITNSAQAQEKLINTVAKGVEQQQEKSSANAAQLTSLLETMQKNNQNEQETIKKHLRAIQSKTLQQYNELNFADLLHDSTQNTPWLKDKTLSLYGWAANYSFIYTLFRILDNLSPLHILEMGLGQTTRLTSQYIAYKNPSATLDVCEHNQDWISIYAPQLPPSDNIKVHHLALEYFDYEGKQNDKYKNLAQVTGNIKYNLIIVDGPVGGGKNFPRSNIIDLIPQNLAEDFIIIFDDAGRAGEQNTIAQTKAKLSAQGIAFGTQQRDALKSQFLIFSKSWEFVQYL